MFGRRNQKARRLTRPAVQTSTNPAVPVAGAAGAALLGAALLRRRHDAQPADEPDRAPEPGAPDA
jgi:MYXO-CTERM domain-containing protein